MRLAPAQATDTHDVLDAPLSPATASAAGCMHVQTEPRQWSGTQLPTGQACPMLSSNKNLRPVLSAKACAKLVSNSRDRINLHEQLRIAHVNKALQRFDLQLPVTQFPVYEQNQDGDHRFLLNEPLKAVLSSCIRMARPSLPQFVELLRNQTHNDYRPNKNLCPATTRSICKGYDKLETLLKIAREGIRVQTSRPPCRQRVRPTNHGSCKEKVNLLRKNLRKEQDANRCLILDADILDIWPEIVISPFGVVPKPGNDEALSGRTIHDLSAEGEESVNALTDQKSIPSLQYEAVDAIAVEILRLRDEARATGARIMLSAGDVASAFRHLGIHCLSVHLLAGLLPEEDALIIELAAPFGWTGSPGFYEVVGGAISFVHGSSTNTFHPRGFFNYHWVDDHVNIALATGNNLVECTRSLRSAMVSILGTEAINEEKFTPWAESLKALGLLFDTVSETVAMPLVKIEKARRLISVTYHTARITRKDYRSLLGSLRHVATCIRAARPFLQRLCKRETNMNRFHSIEIDDDMRQDLMWWWNILHSPRLNGVPMAFFGALPPPNVVIGMDACDNGQKNAFDINYRELLSVAFAVSLWGSEWSQPRQRLPQHIHFRIDNTSAVAWQNKLSSRNPRAQVIIRLLGYWEDHYGLRFSSSHIAGAENIVADAGSRSAASPTHNKLFRSLTRSWTQVPHQLTPECFSNLWRNITASAPSLHPPSPSTRHP